MIAVRNFIKNYLNFKEINNKSILFVTSNLLMININVVYILKYLLLNFIYKCIIKVPMK
jgi:hypothetical protein